LQFLDATRPSSVAQKAPDHLGAFCSCRNKQTLGTYVAGSASGWIKVKTAEWRAANRERYKLLEKR
jgi:hypothetical protein